MWIIKLGDQLVFLMSASFQIFLIILNWKIRVRSNEEEPKAINDESQNKLLPLENVQEHAAPEVSYEISIFNQIQ